MTKQELEQLRYLKNEIRLLEEEYLAMKPSMLADTVEGCTPERWDKHVIAIRGADYKRIDRMSRRIDRKIKELGNELERLNEYVDSIPDSEIRQIIQLRYRNGLSWQQIAFSIGHYDESYPRRKCNKFFELAENAEK